MSKVGEYYWRVRLKCQEGRLYHGVPGREWVEEHELLADTKEDAIAIAAHESGAGSVVGATVEEAKE